MSIHLGRSIIFIIRLLKQKTRKKTFSDGGLGHDYVIYSPEGGLDLGYGGGGDKNDYVIIIRFLYLSILTIPHPKT